MDMNMKEYVNWKMSHDVKYGENEGYPLVLENCRKNKDLKNFRVYGNSVQEYINLIDESTITYGVYIDEVGVENPSVDTPENYGLTDYIDINLNLSYNLEVTFGTKISWIRINYYDTDKNWLSQYFKTDVEANNSYTILIDLPENTTYIRISCIMEDVKCYANLSPKNPLEIQSVGELTTKNLFDKDNLVYYNSGNASGCISTNTGIKYIPSAGWGHYIYTIGLASDYAGKTLCFSWNGNNYNTSPHTLIVIIDSNGTVVTSSGTIITLDNGTKYTIFTLDGEYTTEKLALRFYYNITSEILNEKLPIEFNDVMLCESSEYVPYEPYHKYKIPVKARGKNLWNGANYVESDASNTVCIQYVYASSNDWIKSGVTVTTSATICVNDARTYMRMVVFAQCVDGTSLSSKRVDYSVKGKEIRVSATYTIPQTEKELQRFVIRPLDYSSNSSGIWDAYVKDIQIELGDTATPYEPYIKPQPFNIYLDEPLHKIGEYEDYIDFDRNVTVRNSGEITVTSDMVTKKHNWYYERNWNAYTVKFTNFDAYFNQYSSGDLSNYFKATSGGYTSANLGDNYVFQVGGANTLYIITTPASDETVAEIKAWVDEKYNGGKPLVFTLRRKEPIEEPFNIPELPKTQANTMIYEVVDTSVQPSNMYGKYIKKH